MKAVIQRVTQASVTIEGKVKSSIGLGLLVLLGIEDADTQGDIVWLSSKIVNLRIFNDDNGVMPARPDARLNEFGQGSRHSGGNLSLKDTGGDILLVSQFTLHASTKKGNRPSYIKAAKPDGAIPMYEKMIIQLQNDLGKSIQTGTFGADMKVQLLNDGPVTIIIDSKNPL
jgi:D-aminoacyl-tRNA deacylase